MISPAQMAARASADRRAEKLERDQQLRPFRIATARLPSPFSALRQLP
jgi:hypothetical protein